MKNLLNGEIVPDDEVVFYDGLLYIIGYADMHKRSAYCEHLCLCCEYDEPLTLKDIAEKYKNVHKVIFEGGLHGEVYNYMNHKTVHDPDAEAWEQVGTTVGYA